MVAHQSNDVISVACDTGVVKNDARLGKEEQLSKIVVLTPDLCVGFAGSVELVSNYFNRASSIQKHDFKSVVDFFFSCHEEANRQVEFLLLFNRPTKKIVRIKDGNIIKPLGVAWIGDQPSYETFQQRRKKRVDGTGLVEKGLKIFSPMKSEAHPDNHAFDLLGTMVRAMRSTGAENIFGDVIIANNIDGEFLFRPYSLAYTPAQDTFFVPKERQSEAEAELVEDINFQASAFVSERGARKVGYAVHHVFGEITYLYGADTGQQMRFISTFHGNIKAFMDATAAEYGAWNGHIALRRPPPSGYGLEFEPQRFDKNPLKFEK